MTEKKRNPSLDLVRCLALIYVITAHYLLNNGFYDLPVAGWRMYLLTTLRTVCISCVPIFLMLSGYFLKNAKLTPRYYTRILRLYVTYAITCFLCIGADVVLNGRSHGVFSAVNVMLSFHEKFYSWYINMYLGLFLLIPFLNLLYNSLEKQSHKKVLIWTMLILTAFPALVNSNNITNPSWWLNPSSSSVYHQLMPDWWTGMYPITYYFMGCYLRDHPLKFRQSTKLLLLILSILASGAYNIYRSHSTLFIWGDWSEQRSILCAVMGFLTFSLFQGMDLSGMHPRLCKVFATTSNLGLGAFLLSWIPEQYLYPIIQYFQPDIMLRMHYLPLGVLFVLVCALLLSALVELVSAPVCRGLLWLIDGIAARVAGKRR